MAHNHPHRPCGTQKAASRKAPESASFSERREEDQAPESATEAWFGADPARRQTLAPQLVLQWQREAERLLAQGRSQQAVAVYTRLLALDPAHLPALEGRAQAYRQLGMEQAAKRDEGSLQALLAPGESQEEFPLPPPFLPPA